MFEDSLMESGHQIKAKSKYWSIVALLVNSGVLLALIVWPLLHPEALPKQVMAALMVAPPAPTPPPPQVISTAHIKSEMVSTELLAPSRIPKAIKIVQDSSLPPSMEDVVEGLSSGPPADLSSVIGSTGTGPAVVVRATPPQKVSRPSGVMAGYLLEKTIPQYPAIAKAARVQGLVVLQATISNTGLIENIRVISGPPMLQQAAVDAVRSWRYKAYLLNGEPVEVETTINIIFNLGE
jgi:periplasmic protein TonB